ncbi:bifunctional NAD(P)/FAD-dependent oxidoreductase/class I SAM-dependent methyltransferase [Citricoccus sp. NR2]|uniref:bifunctional NAD(P)/FAD-dependent oxidoreductase/class I SAM-dependent methyltransferase n=1 Tax=Citricoccus sp. NR2 TaxID=3004095 RepID=UPI0022DDE852|nr:bifunctional NAD(P)/FAD-dependent oxidoreductase/class I SAM-dependent methyltransferase [Citricoccus sp. NR2]WBL19811.1 NAD(P)/FAD-dependent oxidoreductase [Citricoccus sp. NR2]
MTSQHQHSPDQHATPPVLTRHADVAIIGGSAAGLAAALQLSRQRRSVIVVDAGQPRNAPAAAMHSYLGHEGRSPREFLSIAREEVRSYGAEILTGRAVNVTRDNEGFRIELTGGHLLRARRVIAATGLTDELPDIPGLAEHWGTSVIHCPFCHGYEAREQRIVALVTSPAGLHAVPLLRQLTEQLTVVVHTGVPADDPQLATLTAAGVRVVVAPVERILDDEAGQLRALRLTDGVEVLADTILVGTRLHAQVAPFAGLGLTASDHPTGVASYVEADPMTGATEVPGIYAAGTLAEPMLQVLPTAAAGSRVGAMVSFDLAQEDLAAAARPVAHGADWEGRYSGERQWSGNPNGSLVAEAQHLTPGTALDIGAGEGGDALWLAEHGWQVTANDISANALDRIRAESQRRSLPVETLQADANAANPFAGNRYDLVTAAYASIPRTPDARAIANLLGAVAPGGRLLIINHDAADLRDVQAHADPETTRAFDHEAFVSTEDIAEALSAAPEWEIEVNERRERPAGAVSTHHVHDVVLRARRVS